MTPTAPPTRMTAWLEQAWLVRYLNRRLSSEEVVWFESYLLDKPDLLAMIEADTRLRDALAADASVRHTERPADGEGRQGGAMTAAAGTDAVALPGVRRGRTAIALAAALAIGVGVGAISIGVVRNGAGDADVMTSPTRVVFDTLRGSDTPPQIEHAGSPSRYVLVEVAVPPDAANIALVRGGEAEQTLTPSPDGFVSFLLDRRGIGQRALQIRYQRNGSAVIKQLDLATLKL